MEIVFSNSARGSMRQGLGGPMRDILCFPLALSVGGLSEDGPGPERRAVLQGLCAWNPALPGLGEQLDQAMADAAAALDTALRQAAAGGHVRIWYSDEPDELCGLCWILNRLDGLGDGFSMVRLPRWELRADGSAVERRGWGEVSPNEWRGFLPLEQPVTPALRRACAAHWQTLRRENAPLRAVVNGQLVSAPESLYDSFIRRELDRVEQEFQEARVIAAVLSRWRLGIGDGLIAKRIEAMIAAGELEAVTRPEEGEPGYRRVLRKRV